MMIIYDKKMEESDSNLAMHDDCKLLVEKHELQDQDRVKTSHRL